MDKPELADGYDELAIHDEGADGNIAVIVGHGNIYTVADAEANHPECFAPEPPSEKEPKPRELADGYARVREQKAGGRTLIFWDSKTRLGGTVGARRCWIEGQDDVPDHVYAPEPEQQEFRKGDWIRYLLFRPAGRKEFLQVTDPNNSASTMVAVDGDGRPWRKIEKAKAELIRHAAPTGPIRVGCYVQLVLTKHLGVVAEESQSMRGHFRMGGFDGWWPTSQLRLIASPEDGK